MMADEEREDRFTSQAGDFEIISFGDKNRPVPKPDEDWSKFAKPATEETKDDGDDEYPDNLEDDEEDKE